MGIFISWAGNRSQLVAEYLHKWLKCVLQSSNPWISSHDIENGSVWNSAINTQLKSHNAGIVCLTKENMNAPWILFEAGALARGLETNRVYTLLIDLVPEDVDAPLGQFNHTLANDKISMSKLINSINLHMEKSLDNDTLQKVFNKYWDDFYNKYNEILENTPKEDIALPPQDQTSMLREILFSVKRLNNRIIKLENSDRFHNFMYDNNDELVSTSMGDVDRYTKQPVLLKEVQVFLKNRSAQKNKNRKKLVVDNDDES